MKGYGRSLLTSFFPSLYSPCSAALICRICVYIHRTSRKEQAPVFLTDPAEHYPEYTRSISMMQNISATDPRSVSLDAEIRFTQYRLDTTSDSGSRSSLVRMRLLRD